MAAKSMSYDELKSEVEKHRDLLSHGWMSKALRFHGVAEIPGKRSDPLIIQFIASTTQQSYNTQNSLSLPEVNAQSQLPVVCSIGYNFDKIDDSDDNEAAWCSAFVNHVMISSGYKGTKSLGARSWVSWKHALPQWAVLFGAIIVLRRGKNPKKGHVGFYVGETSTHFQVLGGNQGKGLGRVSVSCFPKRDWLTFRWPEQVVIEPNLTDNSNYFFV